MSTSSGQRWGADRVPPGTAGIPEPARHVRVAAWASAASATLGFIPLHLVWALGIPLWANGSALLPAVLAVALVRPWGLVIPARVPVLAGRRIPRRFLVISGLALSGFLLLYTGYAIVLGVVQAGDPEAVFSPWILAYGAPQFLIWGIGLLIATLSYRRRTSAGTGV